MMRAPLFAASIFLSAFLLFLIQPMLARLLLPVFGGSPSVWNTCLAFFQILLLAGYAYAHESLERLGVRRQRMVHAAVLLVSIAALPRASRIGFAAAAPPVLRILVVLSATVGVTFLVLSTNSSLTQRWYSLSSHQEAEGEADNDPFWLYAASNAGSLAALLSYPLVVEPLLGLHQQLVGWSIGYVAFVALCAAIMARTPMSPPPSSMDAASAGHARVAWPRRIRWVALAAIASSLLMSVTMQISTDVMAAPLFWVLPLAIYLVTFIIAFSRGRGPPGRVLALLTTIGIALCFTIVIAPTVLPLWFALLALLGTLFTGALFCHSTLAADRPGARHLTTFYLALALGGAIGGVANSIVAPLVFSSVAEFPLTLACLAFVVHPVRRLPRPSLATAAVLGAVMMVAAAGWQRQLVPLAVLAAAVALVRQPGVFPIAATLTAAFVVAQLHFVDPILDQGRSFFGVSRVTETPSARVMSHGVTVHGMQLRDSAFRDVPVSYYYSRGPLGSAVFNAPPGAEIGIVGLGAGALAVLAHPGQRVTYFEIDPLVERMARRDFSFLRDAVAQVAVRIGDGRQLLDSAADNRFDRLVIDAFTSDAVPMHLLTDEAIGIYLRKLKPTGMVVFHISNRYADLSRVFRGWQRAAKRRVAIDQFVPSPDEEAHGVLATVAAAIGRSDAAVRALAGNRQWYWLDDTGPATHWTDDRANLLSVIDRNILKP